MLQHGGDISSLNIRHGMGRAFVSNQQAVTLCEIARIGRFWMHAYLPPIGV